MTLSTYNRKVFLAFTVIYSLLLCICNPTVGSQNQKIDNLNQSIRLEKSESKKYVLFQELITITSNSNLQNAKQHARKALNLANHYKNKQWQPIFNEMKGRIHANLLELDSASHHFNKALKAYKTINNKKGQATTLFKIGWVYKKKGDIENAMKCDLMALDLMEKINDKAGIAGAKTRITEDLNRQERYTDALIYAKDNIAFCLENSIHDELVYAYTNAGNSSIAIHKPDSAFYYYDKALNLAKALNYSNMNLCDLINNKANALKRLGNYNAALKNYNHALSIAKQLNYRNAIVVLIANLGEINLLTGNYNDALKYQLQTVKFQEEDQDVTNLTENYEHVSTIYEKLGNYPLALKYQKKARKMRDSTASIASDKAMSALLTQYETEKKVHTIATQQLQLKQQKFLTWVGIGFAILLLGFLFFGYRSYKARTKSNKLLALKNQQNELLLKEIHHRVKNNLELVKSLMALQTARLTDSKTKDALLASQNRVQSMGIIHQKLYQGENLKYIEMKDYFVNLSAGILDTYNADYKIKIICNMDALELDIDTAIPIGLIVNELLTNALKYAFPNQTNGKILISLLQPTAATLTLEVKDNGIGKAPNTTPKGTGFGSQLINLLTQQLNGKMVETIKNGTSVLFQFKLNTIT
ncbi:tetratricopeptide repeat-containing sensor histidine kinase [Neotamlana sedimentorum]|uniref:tetratricopeptide repeat-containing sensor histidine kinase n=1 Tax=Neotamlana sedimentorum TaxID=1435349 RepID=UPI00069BF5A4|nr:histidine kinase dimerization/phosphoacceptor domain -containing protein [Tamlana sedimentorum]